MGDVFFVITEIGGDIPHQKIGIHAVFYIINDIQIDLLACILFNGELRMMHLVFEFTEHTGAEIVVFGRISIGADAILHLLHQNNQPLGFGKAPKGGKLQERGVFFRPGSRQRK